MTGEPSFSEELLNGIQIRPFAMSIETRLLLALLSRLGGTVTLGPEELEPLPDGSHAQLVPIEETGFCRLTLHLGPGEDS